MKSILQKHKRLHIKNQNWGKTIGFFGICAILVLTWHANNYSLVTVRMIN